MKKVRIYPEKLEEYLVKYPYVSRKIREDEHLKQHHRYWLVYSDVNIKVQEVYQVFDREYYTIRYPESLFGTKSFPCEECYELLVDRSDIIGIENIINDRTSYSGAQIKYWFFTHQEYLYDKKYEGFLSFIDISSKNVIADDKYYFLSGKDINNIFKECKVILDKSKEIKRLRREQNIR